MTCRGSLTEILLLQLQVVVATFILSSSSIVTANEPIRLSIELPLGSYLHKGKILPRTIKKSKTFYQADKEDKEVIEALKKDGFNCAVRSLTEVICTARKPLTEVSKEMVENTLETLKNFPIKFPKDLKDYKVELYKDEPNNQVWVVNGDVTVGDYKEKGYLVEKNKAPQFIFHFPDQDGNPITYLNYYKVNELGYSMVLRSSDADGWSYYFYVEAVYEKAIAL